MVEPGHKPQYFSLLNKASLQNQGVQAGDFDFSNLV